MSDAESPDTPPPLRTGSVALIGRPNAGKSTLLNRVLGVKVAIVSDKPQTTRTQILGIHTEARGQVLFLDTPGIHRPLHKLNRRMMQAAMDALSEADVACLLVDASVPFGHGDQYVLDLLAPLTKPRILLLNKIDLVKKHRLLPMLEQYGEKLPWDEIIPISAISGDGVDRVLNAIFSRLEEGEPAYPDDELTDKSERFLAAELVREKLLAETHDELPFTTAVVVVSWEDGETLTKIWCDILVERDSQKGIVLGKQGERIKKIGTEARRDIEELIGRRVYLDLNVKVDADWREDARLLSSLESG